MDIEQRVTRLERERTTPNFAEGIALRDEIRRDLAARDVDPAVALRDAIQRDLAEQPRDEFQRSAERDAIVDWLRAQVERLTRERDELRGAMATQDQRERRAADRCGVPYEEHGCDWPDAVADVVIHLRADRDRLAALVERARPMVSGYRGLQVPGSYGAEQCDQWLADAKGGA